MPNQNFTKAAEECGAEHILRFLSVKRGTASTVYQHRCIFCVYDLH